MAKLIKASCWLAVACLIGPAVGCNSTPARPQKPDLSPGSVARDALAAYDADQDGKIDHSEAGRSPALKLAFGRIDTNGDQSLDAQEIAERIAHYQAASAALSTGTVMVALDGQPLADAIVTFEPEKFLGPAVTPCEGETDYTGTAVMAGHNEKFPGIFFGLYRVRISKIVNGKEVVPEKYNTDTTLGHEASDDVPGLIRAIRFDLRR